MKAIYPTHIAVRGFQHNLPTNWIMDSIRRALQAGAARRLSFTVWPSGEPIVVTVTAEHLALWRRQYDAGDRLELPEDLLEDIDRILGVNRPSSSADTESAPES